MRNTINILYFELSDRYIQLQITFVKTEDKTIESIETKRTQSKWLIAYTIVTNSYVDTPLQQMLYNSSIP